MSAYGSKYRTWGDYNRSKTSRRKPEQFRYGTHIESGKRVRTSSSVEAEHTYVQFEHTDSILQRTHWSLGTVIDPASINWE